MNPALTSHVAHQRQLDVVRESRRHALASVPPKERRPQRPRPLLVALRPRLAR